MIRSLLNQSDVQKSLFGDMEQPLAEVLRPKNLDEFLGQKHVVGQEGALLNLLNSAQPFSLVLWGPPGCGKTTFAHLIADKFKADFVALSAVSSGLKELRAVVAEAGKKISMGGNKTIIFIDEIHRYTKTQQDALLPYLENGTIYLIGATTENPSFQIVPALLSRLQVIGLKALDAQDILKIIRRGYQYLIKKKGKINIATQAGEFIANHSSGDARQALNLVESSYFASKVTDGVRVLSLDILENLAQQQHIKYGIDEHYDLASALQKSIRGSDPNAAIYWLAKMIAGGEDPRYIARRLIVTASEDIGIADPNALNVAVSCFRAMEIIGMPEGRIPLANAVVYLAKAEKSNVSYKALDKALVDIQQNGKNFPIPNHLKDAHYKDASKYDAGVGYVYSHDNPDIEQNFLPKELEEVDYFKS